MGGRADVGVVGRGQRTVKQADADGGAEDASNLVVDLRLRYLTGGERGGQGLGVPEVSVGHLQIVARRDRPGCLMNRRPSQT